MNYYSEEHINAIVGITTLATKMGLKVTTKLPTAIGHQDAVLCVFSVTHAVYVSTDQLSSVLRILHNVFMANKDFFVGDKVSDSILDFDIPEPPKEDLDPMPESFELADISDAMALGAYSAIANIDVNLVPGEKTGTKLLELHPKNKQPSHLYSGNDIALASNIIKMICRENHDFRKKEDS